MSQTGILETDAYKFSMAQAGWPLRQETFHYAHRRGGPQVLAVDVGAWVRELLPTVLPGELDWLADFDYEPGPASQAALETTHIRVDGLPIGAVFHDREPVFSVTGPSALVSWLEPSLLLLNYRIQVASLALSDPEGLAAEVAVVCCDEQAELIRQTLDNIGIHAPAIRVATAEYGDRVLETARQLVAVVEDAGRIFEVGMRSATCREQHRIALRACREAGITKTSNVHLAHELGMTPVGTMGHEHVQRFASDRAAFLAMVERRPGRASFLLDTFDTLGSGIPTALDIIAAQPERGHSIRYDSGDKQAQYRAANARANALGIRPTHILEDGFDLAMTRVFEQLRVELGVPPELQLYGYGGFLVAGPAPGGLTRNRVSAVWKLSQTGTQATMKFADADSGAKTSLPGEPVLFRGFNQATTIVGQRGEAVPPGTELVTRLDLRGEQPVPDWSVVKADLAAARSRPASLRHSAETKRLVTALTATREASS